MEALPGAQSVAGGRVSAERCEAFVIAFDRGDVAWLRGYCHLLMTFTEAYLAHDGQELFDHSAHLFFPKAVSPYTFLGPTHPTGSPGSTRWRSWMPSR